MVCVWLHYLCARACGCLRACACLPMVFVRVALWLCVHYLFVRFVCVFLLLYAMIYNWCVRDLCAHGFLKNKCARDACGCAVCSCLCIICVLVFLCVPTTRLFRLPWFVLASLPAIANCSSADCATYPLRGLQYAICERAELCYLLSRGGPERVKVPLHRPCRMLTVVVLRAVRNARPA